MPHAIFDLSPKTEVFVVVGDDPSGRKPTVVGPRDKDDQENAKHQRRDGIHDEQDDTGQHIEVRAIRQCLDDTESDTDEIGQDE